LGGARYGDRGSPAENLVTYDVSGLEDYELAVLRTAGLGAVDRT
jgi:hypothetical protein